MRQNRNNGWWIAPWLLVVSLGVASGAPDEGLLRLNDRVQSCKIPWGR